MCRRGDFKVEIVTRNFYQGILRKYLRERNIQNIYFNRIVPLMHYFEQEAVLRKNEHFWIQTIAFLPKQSALKLSGRKQRNALFLKLEINQIEKLSKQYTLQNFDIFSIKMRFFTQQNALFSYNIIEINNMKYL